MPHHRPRLAGLIGPLRDIRSRDDLLERPVVPRGLRSERSKRRIHRASLRRPSPDAGHLTPVTPRRVKARGEDLPSVDMDTMSTATRLHGGRLVAQRLKARGVTKLFTLSGGHLFSIYDGCREEGIDIVDTRHEQAAAFAAEGWAKVTREPGVAALTAGPGVTNGMSA